MAKKANSLAHTKWMCKYHIVFAAKYRRKVFYGGKRNEIVKILKEVNNWRKVRNKLIHNLVNTKFTSEDVKEIALKGNELVTKLNNKSTLVNAYFDAKNK